MGCGLHVCSSQGGQNGKRETKVPQVPAAQLAQYRVVCVSSDVHRYHGARLPLLAATRCEHCVVEASHSRERLMPRLRRVKKDLDGTAPL